MAADFLKDHRGGSAAAFFSRKLKNCMNLIEFQCLHMKYSEIEWIWCSSTNISGSKRSRQWNSKYFLENHGGGGAAAVSLFYDASRQVFFISHRGAVGFFFKHRGAAAADCQPRWTSLIPIQQFNIRNPSSDEQFQFNDLEASPFHLSDDSEQLPPYS